MAKRHKHKSKSPTISGSHLTFDFNGKVMFVKKLNQDKLPSVINPKAKVKK